MKLIPTKQQQDIINSAKDGKNITVKALAGSSKTTTCLMVAEEVHKHSLYVAYNKSIADEASTKFPAWVECRTMHSIAWRAIVQGTKYKGKLNGFLDRKDVAKVCNFSSDIPKKQQDVLVEEIISTVTSFCNSGYDSLEDFLNRSKGISLDLMLYTPAYWSSMVDMNSKTKIHHDTYLKLYQLAKPKLDYQLLYLDESQDFSPAILAILLSKENTKSQKIFIGDNHQCLVPGTKVSGKLIEDIHVGDAVDAAIAGEVVSARVGNIHKYWINDTVVEITTSTGKTIKSTKNHTHFTSFPTEKHGYIVYLMYKKGKGYRIGCTQGFRQRCSEEGASKCWIIGTFGEDQVSARVFEQVTSFTYGIPTLVYKPRSVSGEFPREYYDRVFSEVDSETGALRLLNDLSLEIPHYIPQAVASEAITFSISMLGDAKNKERPYNRYSVTFSTEQAELLISCYPELPLRPAKKEGTFRLDSAFSDLGKVYAIWDKVHEVFPKAALREVANVSNSRPLSFCLAANVVVGMSVAVETEEGLVMDKVTSVTKVEYSGYVYDLDIEKYHNFIADGIVTHNSIYGFREAINAFDYLPSTYTSHNLTTSFRFTQEIADIALKVLRESGYTGELIGAGNDSTGTKACLARTNADLFARALDLAEKGEKLYIVGGMKDLFSKLYSGLNLKFGSKDKIYDKQIATFPTWDAFVEATKTQVDLAKIVTIIKQTSNLHSAITAIKKAEVKDMADADYILSTAHKSKGLGFEEVTIVNGFIPRGDWWEEMNREEQREYLVDSQILNLIYISITRSERVVTLPSDIREWFKI